MADEKMVEVTLDRSRGVRDVGMARAVHYGPGKVKMPVRHAELLGLTDAPARTGAARRGAGGKGDEATEYDSFTVDELRAEAEARELTVKRGDGADGDPLKADYVKALKKADRKGA